MIRRPPISTQSRSSAASDVYKRQSPQWVTDARREHPVNVLPASSVSRVNRSSRGCPFECDHPGSSSRLRPKFHVDLGGPRLVPLTRDDRSPKSSERFPSLQSPRILPTLFPSGQATPI